MIVYFDVLMKVMKSTSMINFDVLINITDQMFINMKKKKKKKLLHSGCAAPRDYFYKEKT
jgi:hypothetical protein